MRVLRSALLPAAGAELLFSAAPVVPGRDPRARQRCVGQRDNALRLFRAPWSGSAGLLLASDRPFRTSSRVAQ